MPLKNPPATSDWLTQERAIVNNGINGKYPVADTPPPQYGGYPQPGDLDDALQVEGCDGNSLLADHLQVMGYVPVDGTYAGNAQRRSDCFVNAHPPISRTIADCITGGFPIPDATAFVPPPLVVTFSDAEIEARLQENPPRRYDGAPCYDPNNTQYNFKAANAHAYLTMLGDEALRGMDTETIRVLTESQWGEGQEYFPSNFDKQWARTKTPAEIFWRYDPRGKVLAPNGPNT